MKENNDVEYIKQLALNSSNFNEKHLIFGHKEDFAIEIEPAMSNKLKYNPKTFNLEKTKVFNLRIYHNSRIVLSLPYHSMWEVKGRIRQFNFSQFH